MALIYYGLVAMTFMVGHPLFSIKMSQYWPVLKITNLPLFSTDSMKKLTKNMGPHCTVRLEHLLVAIPMTLTLEPIKKSMYNIYTVAGLLWLDGLAQSPSEAMPFNLWEGPGVQYSLDGQSVALWEDVFLKSLCLLNVP